MCMVYQHQLKEVLELVQKFPNQKFVIDHCAKPDIKNKSIEPWKTLIKEIASNPNVYCKLSGLLTESNWQQWEPKDFYPYLDVVFEAFGAKRILFGSDWPVMLLSGKYVQWKNLVEIYLKPFSAEEQNNIMGTNAINFYNL
ncbi:MAG TPA: amidohydrolase, partial [Chitinophagaceae bacterium]|nr:amidohydrolase [Chitinophagaceae bacterium]